MKLVNKFIKHIAIYFVLLAGVLSNAFASLWYDQTVLSARQEWSDTKSLHSAGTTTNWIAASTKLSIAKSAVGIEDIKAWEALIDLPLLRTNVTKLQAVSDFSIAKNIDPSIIKTELQSLPEFKDDLIKGFEISNGTTAFPKIVNEGDISTNGALHGEFINGQFVPNGNALPNGIMDYVALPNGQILLGTQHSFLSQGADVLAAGTVKLTDGVVKYITNLSGHYRPNPGETMNFLRVFKNAGVNIDLSFLSIYKENGTIFKQISMSANERKLYE